ncbi:hypothetical protein GEMRC1_011596 [Eukaryota sp. GEM-RC1]
MCRWQAVALLKSRTPLPASLSDLCCSVENRFLEASTFWSYLSLPAKLNAYSSLSLVFSSTATTRMWMKYFGRILTSKSTLNNL